MDIIQNKTKVSINGIYLLNIGIKYKIILDIEVNLI